MVQVNSPGQVITADHAIARAIEIAGVDDFGAEGWREGLERSLGALVRMPLQSEVRRASVNRLVADLATRLRIEQWYKHHPEVNAQVVEGPVFVFGLPRTGTTATVGMLAADSRFRFLRSWEGACPLPPPVAGEEDADPRVIAARQTAYTDLHIHIHDPDGPEEDPVMLAGLAMLNYYGTLPVPDDYTAWWLNADFGAYYAYQERVLKMLQSRRPPYLWLLKSPLHLFQLREITRRYPAAKFIMTHRDPAKVIASVASLHTTLHEDRCPPGSIDPSAAGPRYLAFWVEGMRRGLAARAEIGEHRFIDVSNADVVKRPAETFERIYNHLGMPLTPGLLRKLEDYNTRNAPGAFGAHSYTAEQYGISDQWIRTAFSDYIERFGL